MKGTQVYKSLKFVSRLEDEMICPNAPWYWPFHRFVEWREGTYRRRVRTVTGAPLSRCPCGEVRVDR